VRLAVSVPGSYLLVADMDGVKMVSVDGSDESSVYVAAVGRPFFSNVVALTYDPDSRTAYYSDVARYSRPHHAILRLNSTTRARPDPRGPTRTFSRDPGRRPGSPTKLVRVRAGLRQSPRTLSGRVRSGPCSGI